MKNPIRRDGHSRVLSLRSLTAQLFHKLEEELLAYEEGIYSEGERWLRRQDLKPLQEDPRNQPLRRRREGKGTARGSRVPQSLWFRSS